MTDTLITPEQLTPDLAQLIIASLGPDAYGALYQQATIKRNKAQAALDDAEALLKQVKDLTGPFPRKLRVEQPWSHTTPHKQYLCEQWLQADGTKTWTCSCPDFNFRGGSIDGGHTCKHIQHLITYGN